MKTKELILMEEWPEHPVGKLPELKSVMQIFADQEKQALKDTIVKRLNDFSKDKHGRIFTTEVIELISKL